VARRGDPATLDLAARVSVRHDPALDRRLPAERVSRVTVDLGDGASYTVEQPNPVGDADHEPFGPLEVRDKLSRLIGADDARRVLDVVAALPEAPDGAALLGELP
jgi:2-methylcitrate dehydratase PrpD